MIELSEIKKAKEIIDNQINLNLKSNLGTWEYHCLCLLSGESKNLIEKLENPIKLKRANHDYKLILEGKL